MGETHRFYQITNAKGCEMELSDSETDSDQNQPSAENVYNCDKCHKQFDRQHLAIRHMNNAHKIEDFQHLKCIRCAISFPCRSILEKHLRRQCFNSHKSIICQYCDVRFHWQSNCDDHISKQHIKPPQNSPNVTVPESASKSLNKPSISSTKKQRPFQCDICSRCFWKSDHLKRHLKKHAKGDSRLSCDICKLRFKRKSALE